MNTRRYITWHSVLAGVFLSVSALAQQFPPANVNVVEAKSITIAPTSWVPGTLVSRNDAQIAADVSGRLVELADLGSRVNKGDVIARIDDATLKIELAEQKANVTNAIARLKFLESEVTRKTKLEKSNLTSKTDLDETISQRDIAKGDLAGAKARLARTKQQLAYTKLVAPFNGLISERLSSLGEYVNNGNAIVRLVETENLESSVFAPVTSYPFLSESKNISIQSALGDGKAPIKAIIPVADTRSHLMEVRLDMSSFNWPVGLSIKAGIASGEEKQVIAVPRDALVLRRDGTSIFRVSSDNKAEKITVVVGLASEELVEVQGSVNPGDKIIVRGAERLQPGAPVQIKADNSSLVSSK